MASVRSLLLFLFLPLSFAQVMEIIHGLDKAADFAMEHYQTLNFDGLLGYVIAEAQIRQSLELPVDEQTASNLKVLLLKCEEIRRRIVPILPKTPSKMLFLEKYLLRPENWMNNETFTGRSLQNLGIYQSWTVDDIIKDKHASYKGVPSDYCLMEILAENCYIDSFCEEMMLAPRIDKGYLLSHRVFYLQIVRLRRCRYNRDKFRALTEKFCSLMLKETRTNDYLGFPAHDIALEQMVLCGLEGYSEFLNGKWKNKVLSWQTFYGCFKSKEDDTSKRSSNVIAYGCSDHTTGLGAAALALNLKYVLEKIY